MAESFSRQILRHAPQKEGGVPRLGRAGIRRFRPRGGHQNSPFRGRDYMIPYMVGKLAPNSSHLTRGLVKYVPGRGYFRAVPSQNEDKYVSFPPPQLLNWSKVDEKSCVTFLLCDPGLYVQRT